MGYQYTIHVNWSNEGNNFIADVPELNGCIADGSSFTEALENVQVVIEEWIATATLLGWPIPDPKSKYGYA